LISFDLFWVSTGSWFTAPFDVYTHSSAHISNLYVAAFGLCRDTCHTGLIRGPPTGRDERAYAACQQWSVRSVISTGTCVYGQLGNVGQNSPVWYVRREPGITIACHYGRHSFEKSYYREHVSENPIETPLVINLSLDTLI